MSDVAGHGKQLPSAEREQQLRMELQQVDHQISQQTQMRGLEVGTSIWSSWGVVWREMTLVKLFKGCLCSDISNT